MIATHHSISPVSQGPRLPVEASVWAGPRHWVEGRWPHERLRRLRRPLAAHCGYFQTSVEVGDLGRLVTNSNNGSTVHLEVNKRQKRRTPENPLYAMAPTVCGEQRG